MACFTWYFFIENNVLITIQDTLVLLLTDLCYSCFCLGWSSLLENSWWLLGDLWYNYQTFSCEAFKNLTWPLLSDSCGLLLTFFSSISNNGFLKCHFFHVLTNMLKCSIKIFFWIAAKYFTGIAGFGICFCLVGDFGGFVLFFLKDH